MQIRKMQVIVLLLLFTGLLLAKTKGIRQETEEIIEKIEQVKKISVEDKKVTKYGGCEKVEKKAEIVYSDFSGGIVSLDSNVETKRKEQKHWVEFVPLKNTWIDFDVENNKWIYSGDLDEMIKIIVENKEFDYLGIGITVMEIIREIKEEKAKKTK